MPWIVLLKRHPDVPNDLNLNLGARVATVLAGLFLLTSFLLIPGLPWSLPFWPGVLLPLAAVAGIAWIQRGFLGLVRRRYGVLDATATVPLLVLFFIGCGLAVPLGYWKAWREG